MRPPFRDASLFEYLRAYIAANRYAPTLDEMQANFGVVRNTILHSLDRLESQGYIARPPKRVRAIRLLKETYQHESCQSRRQPKRYR